ncbi:hypothetical protein CTZ27_12545 [Streptomyces griseocarneus]|nr:hypothetical protein CTZ27_12545 [Streptomyces griseocarneus]
MRTIEGAPALNRPAATGERALGLASAVALFTGLALAGMKSTPPVLGVVVLVAALALVLGWRSFHLGAPRRRPHTKMENRVAFGATVMIALPGSRILWDNPTSLEGALVGAAVPTVVLAVYLVLRWSR